MISILIKSFNRAYYLDRAIYSLKKHLIGNYSITVLDDGTPEKYIDKIQSKYPDVIIKTNKNALQKNKAIEDNILHGTEINGFKIPTNLWKDEVEKASEYFIMTEDDVWLTQDIDLESTIETMRQNEMSLLKVGWISNREINAKYHTLPNNITAVEPSFFVGPRWLMKGVFKNQYKIYSILYRLKVMDKEMLNEYWIMNSLLMGIYKRDYWLYLWKNIEGRVDEQAQIINATQWYRKNKDNKLNYGKFDDLRMNTTFISSATNSYHQYGIQCDINYFNHIMNSAWYKGEFDSLNSYPKDISEEYFIQFLEENYSERCTPENWKSWADKFKNQYRSQGVDVDS